MTDRLPRSQIQPVPASAPIALLDQLAKVDLPCTIIQAEHIELLRILQIGGAVRASIPQPSRTLHGYHQDLATLLEITTAGRWLLRSFSRSEPPEKKPQWLATCTPTRSRNVLASAFL